MVIPSVLSILMKVLSYKSAIATLLVKTIWVSLNLKPSLLKAWPCLYSHVVLVLVLVLCRQEVVAPEINSVHGRRKLSV